jgi:hypothetical protein
MGRPRKGTGAELATVEDCERAMAELLVAIVQIEVLEARHGLLVAQASAEIEPEMNDAKGRKIEAELALRNYYYAHLVEIEANGAKHLQLAGGVIGRRDDPPAIKPLNRSWKLEDIKRMVRAEHGLKYFHEAKEPELDKEKLKELDAEALKKVGLKTEAGETFYAEPTRAPAKG